jgi:O-antigen/teichoic acid export membrane protein
MRSSVSSIASEAGHSAPDIVLGRTVGMEGTGLFSRAMGYVQLLERVLQDVLRSVMLPYMAEVERSGENAKEKVIMVLDNVVSVSLFFIGLTAILAKPLVIVLYGKQWLEAVPLAYVLCPAIALRCVAPTLAASLVASGRITTVMRTSLISAILKFGCLAVFSLYGLLWGAVGFVAAEVVNVAVLLYFCNRSGMFPWASYVSIMTKNLPVAAAGMVPAIMAMIYVPIPVPLIEVMVYLGIVGSLSAIVWLATLAILDRPPKNEIVRLLVLIKAKIN